MDIPIVYNKDTYYDWIRYYDRSQGKWIKVTGYILKTVDSGGNVTSSTKYIFNPHYGTGTTAKPNIKVKGTAIGYKD